MRVFIGIPLEERVKRRLGRLIERLKRGRWPIRWVRAEGAHLTVVFLGEVKEERLEEVKKAVERGSREVGPFVLKTKGIGAFPNFFKPQVFWVGLRGDLASWARLAKAVEGELERVGFELKKKEHVPHLTLGRVRRGGGRVYREISRQLEKLKIERFFEEEIVVKEVVVWQSRLSQEGPVYKRLFVVELDSTAENG